MADLTPGTSGSKDNLKSSGATATESSSGYEPFDDQDDSSDSELGGVETNDDGAALIGEGHSNNIQEYKVYRRRWYGLAQLVLLNIIVSWDWLSFAAVSKTSALYFGVRESSINWMSTGFLFAFCAVSPIVLWTLNRGGPKPSIVTASVLILIGNWIRYAGARSGGGHFGVVMAGQIIIGLAQPFVLTAPTRYSDLWFTERGRISATAVASLANPFGGAVGQLINPLWASKPSDIPNMVLYISIISSIICIPSFFLPTSPPLPPSPTSHQNSKRPLLQCLSHLFHTLDFYLIFIPFAIYVSLFSALTSLLPQILAPHAFSETASGLAGAILILSGLLFSALTSPFLDHHPSLRLASLKTLVPTLALSYILYIPVPLSRSKAGVYIVSAMIGMAGFGLVPLALEMMKEIEGEWGSGELSSVVAWTGGQAGGAVCLLVMDKLQKGVGGRMDRALVFEAVVGAVGVPLVWAVGWNGWKKSMVGRR